MGLLVCDSGWSLAAQEFGSASTGDAVRDPSWSWSMSTCPMEASTKSSTRIPVLRVASRGSEVSRSIVLGVLLLLICMKSARE